MPQRRRTAFEAARDKRAAVRVAEGSGEVLDNQDLRLDLLARVKGGGLTLDQAQAALKKLKRSARNDGGMTRAKVFRSA